MNSLLTPSTKRRISKLLLNAGIALTLITALLPPTRLALAQDAEPVANVLLFYSPTCGHCEMVITQVIPPLFAEYGNQLNILAVDMSSAGGQKLFAAALEHFGVPLENGYVPFLIVGETILVGSGEIPEQLPGIIEQGLEQGGIGWPEIPGLAAVVEYQQGISNSDESTTQGKIQSVLAKMGTNFKRDLTANVLSVFVLVGLITSTIASIRRFQSKKLSLSGNNQPSWLLPGLLVIGLIVAAYLTYVEASDTSAVCGPVGDCNTVQQSRYATVFGIIPVGVLGLFGYTFLIASWIITSFGPPAWQNISRLVFWLTSLAGTLFSIYLTFLEPFVIGATCAWCLTSAVIMGMLLWLSTPSGVLAYKSLGKPAQMQASEP